MYIFYEICSQVKIRKESQIKMAVRREELEPGRERKIEREREPRRTNKMASSHAFLKGAWPIDPGAERFTHAASLFCVRAVLFPERSSVHSSNSDRVSTCLLFSVSREFPRVAR